MSLSILMLGKMKIKTCMNMYTSVSCPYAMHGRLLFGILSNIKSDYEILKGFFTAIERRFCPCFDFDSVISVCVCYEVSTKCLCLAHNLWEKLFCYHCSFNWKFNGAHELTSQSFFYSLPTIKWLECFFLTEYTAVCIQ